MTSNIAKNLDVTIHNRRILNIIDKTIDRVASASILYNILTNSSYSFAYEVVSDEVRHKLALVKSKYVGGITEDTIGHTRKILSGPESNIRVIAELLEYLKQNQEIQAYAQKYLPVPSVYKTFVKCLNELNNSIAAHLEENVSQERAREERLRICRLKNEQASKEIAVLEKELAEKKSDFNASLMGKNLLVNRHQNKIEKIRQVTQEAIDRRAEECEVAIAADNVASETTMQNLTDQLQELTRKYEERLKTNLEEERALRLMRTMVEDQLAQWMKTFDHDMADKQTEEEKQQKEFELEKRKYEEIQKKLDEQEEEYDELMQEKAAYEQQLVEQKLFLFILNRSARRIQRAFRAYKLRKLAKKAKKAKKGKNKKKL